MGFFFSPVRHTIPECRRPSAVSAGGVDDLDGGLSVSACADASERFIRGPVTEGDRVFGSWERSSKE